MTTQLKLLGALLAAAAFSTGALAQTAATPAGGDSSQQMNGDSAKQAEKQAKKQKKQAKRDRNQNGANGPSETSSKPQPASGTGSQ
ncbi:MAG: hypothetical protein GAK35_00824 [Herbaspirillum frisingense]|uniref:Cell envelope biogenesis protein TolA n=1 Tax=Herbaspirillum frisingense TaxID=92645 RepID=A0A7V8JVK9_9BURK|nr:MAG: hypothetical protein GAK35_00824 [Herbaspirillum frisingense]